MRHCLLQANLFERLTLESLLKLTREFFMSDVNLVPILHNTSTYFKVPEWLTRRLNPFSKQQILNSSKLKDFSDDNFKLDENAREFSRVENTVGKGEIARHEQFLLNPQCFQKRLCTADT